MAARRIRPGRRAPRRQRRSRLLHGIVLLLLLAGAAALVWLWHAGQSWRPRDSDYPDQGAYLTDAAGAVRMATLRAIGARFVYVRASIGAERRDEAFARNFAAARRIGMPVGVVHEFDPCATADAQSANFVVMVPRDAQLLPAAIALDRLADDCPRRISEATIESELITLVNQIEIHTGLPVLLKAGRAFEERYGIAAGFERNLWLSQNWLEPDYGQRPWLMWTANDALRTEAAEQPIAWVVVRPGGERE
ncbi:lysozyme [Erythrobacteraceae bacterium CFH 75059]|uniref:glycoside hydrolase family 25 protein n=1 Tax=Qipengyuania thermophila TaxID=2509361 RepID=UPI001020D86E|nr:glycoside hydrolase family 25 protein [Qipengyuania thermophila]TCD02087.1 lysozyme [Erythrobacteraceae bacterium CFH 75059]